MTYQEQLEAAKAELSNVLEESTTKSTAEAELAVLKNKIAYYKSDAHVQARIKSQITAQTVDTLKRNIAMCETIVNEMPIYSARTRENRKWNPSRFFACGNQINLIYQLLTGIQYAATEHKEQMLAYTKLPEDVIEETVAAFGRTSYFNPATGEITPEIPYDIETLQRNLPYVAALLDIPLDISMVSTSILESYFKNSHNNAVRASQEEASTEVLRGQLISA